MKSPMTLESALLTPTQFRARLGAAVLDAIEAMLETTTPELAPARRALRCAKNDLLSAGVVNILWPPTQRGVLGLVSMGLCTSAHALKVLEVPFEDTLPLVEAPAGTAAAVWQGWSVWAIQCPVGETWTAQTPDGDVTIQHPDYLITHTLGGAQYRARYTEIETV